ncbi:MAG TPA: hypothetical protein PK725_12555 [Rhodocyclaceae bacterium]|nr:hypothetical protein [Rhodocyclaceae bacterium]
MPKVLIIEATIVNLGDDRGGVHQGPAEMPEVSKDIARTLVQSGRALYTVRKDDPSRGGIYTASAEMLKAAERVRKSRAGKTTTAEQSDQKDEKDPSGE